jgi:PmbA protein
MIKRAAIGIDEHEIFHSSGFGYSLTFSGGEIKSKEESREAGFGLRVLKDERLGFSYCDKNKKINDAAKEAAALSRFSPKTDFSFVPKTRYPKLNIMDKKIKSIDANELKGIMDSVKDGVEKKAKKARVILSAGYELVSLDNSLGFSGEYDSTSISVYAEGMKEDGFGFAYFDSSFLPADFSSVGEEAGSMAKKMKGAKKLKKGRYSVIFSQSAIDELLNIMLPSFSGDWKRKKTSRLADKEGKQVFSRQLSIYEDGLANAHEARPFDDEGTKSKKIPLIEKGVIKNFIYDREIAALEGIKKSGFCNRAHYSALPGTGISNLVIAKGEYSDLEQELKDPLIVHSLHGSHTANTTTGDFGLEVNVAFHKDKPVRGFLLSGNIFKLLKDKIYLEKKRKTYGSMIAPRFALEHMQVVS